MQINARQFYLFTVFHGYRVQHSFQYRFLVVHGEDIARSFGCVHTIRDLVHLNHDNEFNCRISVHIPGRTLRTGSSVKISNALLGYTFTSSAIVKSVFNKN